MHHESQATEYAEEEDIVPLTAQEAQSLREKNPSYSPWWVVGWQVLVGLFASAIALVLTSQTIFAVSVACGALAVIIPAALFARGLMSQFASASSANAVLSFFVWELVKIGVTVGVLLMSHRWVEGLSWPAMLVGLVVTMKVYWVALGIKRKPTTVQNLIA
jgi:ATP synthase protein I